MLVFKSFLVSRPKKVKTIPEHFPNSVPIYDTERIESISFLSAEKKGRAVQTISYISRKTLTPFSKILYKNIGGQSVSTVGLDDVINFLNSPVTDPRDIVHVEWEDLQAEPSFILDFYRTTLEKNGFDVSAGYVSTEIYDLNFDGEEQKVNGALHIEDSNEKGTDFVSLTVSMPTYGN